MQISLTGELKPAADVDRNEVEVESETDTNKPAETSNKHVVGNEHLLPSPLIITSTVEKRESVNDI